MAEQKIVQHRRDIYSNFAPSKIKPGEIIMITSGDPNSSSGKSVYACITAGDVQRLATQDELSTYDQAAQTAAEAAATRATTFQAEVTEPRTQAAETVSSAICSETTTDTRHFYDQKADIRKRRLIRVIFTIRKPSFEKVN